MNLIIIVKGLKSLQTLQVKTASAILLKITRTNSVERTEFVSQ